jgi:hypothetical protein
MMMESKFCFLRLSFALFSLFFSLVENSKLYGETQDIFGRRNEKRKKTRVSVGGFDFSIRIGSHSPGWVPLSSRYDLPPRSVDDESMTLILFFIFFLSRGGNCQGFLPDVAISHVHILHCLVD